VRRPSVAALALALLLVPAAAAKGPMRIPFPEGYSVRQMVDRVATDRSLAIRNDHVRPAITGASYAKAAAAAQPPALFAAADTRHSIEGFLFPSTYFFDTTTTGAQIVVEQLQQFTAQWAEVALAPRAKRLGPYAVLTIASMVQREASVPAERRLIAAVIYNRLDRKMPLGIDATLRYGLGIPGTKSLTAREIASDSPYNTDRFPGLPPTPIDNPGLAAMKAAADPAAIAALYYVRLPSSQHHFFTASESVFCAKLVQWGYHPC
jgi:peptidoglycan lytic transglycosylase G